MKHKRNSCIYTLILTMLFMVLFSVEIFATNDVPDTNDGLTVAENNVDKIKEQFPEYTLVSDVDDLLNIANKPDGKYVLTNDIDLSGFQKGEEYDGGSGWEPFDFAGVLEGAGHRISNLTIYGDTKDADVNIGLFSKLEGHVNNLGLTDINVNISGENVSCGGFAGISEWPAHINGCFVTGKIQVSDCSYGQIGGITGYLNKGYIKNCYSDVEISVSGKSEGSWGYLGGIAGLVSYESGDSNEISCCYSIGSVSVKDSLPGFQTGMISAVNEYVSNCYYMSTKGQDKQAVAKSPALMKLKGSYTGFDFDNVWEIDSNTSYEYPQLRRCRQIAVANAKVTALPTKTTYYATEEKLDLSGSKMEIVYEDGNKAEIPFDDSYLTYKIAVGKQKASLYFAGFVTSFEFDVIRKKPVVKSGYTSLTYEIGESFSLADVLETNGKFTISESAGLTEISNDKEVACKKAGSTSIIVIAPITDKYEAAEVTIPLTIKKHTYPGTTYIHTEDSNSGNYTDTYFSISLKNTEKDILGDITYASSNPDVISVDAQGKCYRKAPGTVTITVSAKETDTYYGVSVQKSFTVIAKPAPSTDSKQTVKKPAKIVLSSVKNSKTKSIVVKWKKAAADGYEVQYTLDKKLKKKLKTKSTSKSTITFKKLKKGKTYYVRVRAFNYDINHKKVYGDWSKVKKVKIKK